MELVECTQDFWEFVRLLRTHEENNHWFLTQTDISYGQQVEYMTQNAHRYKICLLDGKPVGYIGIIKENEITYCVDPKYKGKGIGTFMVSELIKSKDDLIAFVLPQNIASSKVFEKLGFQKQLYYSKKI